MKKFLSLLLFLILSVPIFAQVDKKVDSLSYAGIKIAVPENCATASEYELTDCNGATVQWLYLTEDMLKSVPAQFIKQIRKQPNFGGSSKLLASSFGSDLKGIKYKIDNPQQELYRIIAYGTVNNQPLLLNIGVEKNFRSSEDLPDFLQQLISFKDVGKVE